MFNPKLSYGGRFSVKYTHTRACMHATCTRIHLPLTKHVCPFHPKYNELMLLALTSLFLLLSFVCFFLFFWYFCVRLSFFLIPSLCPCGPPVHKSFINNSVNNIKSIVFSKVVLINMNEFICLHQSMINAH